jgi:peptidoglycan/xylan/chitin deacetylase (PgdA/CDA1 family)
MLRSNTLIVLTYHRVLAEKDPLFPDVTTGSDFDMQARVLCRFFRTFTLSEAFRRLSEGSLPRRSVAITFDDGYLDNLEVAFPLLERYRLPATFFVATGFLSGENMWNDRIIEAVRRFPGDALDLQSSGIQKLDTSNAANRRRAIDTLIAKLKYVEEPQRSELVDCVVSAAGGQHSANLMMSEKDLQVLAGAGMEIGAHTKSHPILARARDDIAREEIAGSRKFLQNLLDDDINFFAYPNGRPERDFHDKHCNMVRDAGFSGAVTTHPDRVDANTDRYRIPRMSTRDTNPAKFAMRLSYMLL